MPRKLDEHEHVCAGRQRQPRYTLRSGLSLRHRGDRPRIRDRVSRLRQRRAQVPTHRSPCRDCSSLGRTSAHRACCSPAYGPKRRFGSSTKRLVAEHLILRIVLGVRVRGNPAVGDNAQRVLGPLPRVVPRPRGRRPSRGWFVLGAGREEAATRALNLRLDVRSRRRTRTVRNGDRPEYHSFILSVMTATLAQRLVSAAARGNDQAPS